MFSGEKNADRYLLPIYAPLNIIAGLGWTALILLIEEKLTNIYKHFITATIIVSIIGIQMIFSLSIFPYNLAFYNPLLGGGGKAPQVMQIGWGEGLDKAAIYLNSKEGVENLRVLSWYAYGPFSFIFKGTASNIPASKNLDIDWDLFHIRYIKK